jgi:nicotinamidase-related amidase
MLKTENAILVVIDIQGRLSTLMHEKEEFFKNAVRMIKGVQALEIPVIWNEQLPDKLGPTIPEIRQALIDAAPLVKNTFSCCGNKDFIKQLETIGRRQVMLVGMETHVCVYQTAIDLRQAGYDVYLIADAVSSRTPESVETALFELLRVAEGDRFKQIINIVK